MDDSRFPVQVFVFPVLVVALAVRIAIKSYPWWPGDDQVDKWVPVFLCLLGTGVCVMLSVGLAVGLAYFIGSIAEQEWHECWKAEMVSMRNADGITGSLTGGLFMVSGYVESKQVYHYYTKLKNGGFRPHSWTADERTDVFEENRQDGTVVQWDKKFKHPWVGWFALESDDLAMQFHIPIGSIQHKFELK